MKKGKIMASALAALVCVGALTGSSIAADAENSNAKIMAFAGWAETPDGDVKYQPGDEINVSEDTDLYAKWVETQTVWDYDYTGAVQTFTAPVAGTYKLQVWGSEGGNDSGNGDRNCVGGRGGYSEGEIHLTSGENLYVFVGESGLWLMDTTPGHYSSQGKSVSQTYAAEAEHRRTFNGGGYATQGWAGAGGGATDISTSIGSTGADSESEHINTRVIVAGGGGGGGYADYGAAGNYHGYNNSRAYGGGLSGGRGQYDNAGTQTSGNALWAGGIAPYDAGGGGGGYYGGGASQSGAGNGTSGGAGSGGSGYIGGVENGKTIAGNQTMPSTDGGTEKGHSGNGYARITYVGK